MLHRFFLTTCLAIAALRETAAFAPAVAKKSTDTRLMMDTVDRRSFVSLIPAAAAAAATVALSTGSAPAAFALSSDPADNEIVKEQRTVTGKLDVNNAPVADYMKYPGLYPTIGGKIANNGPYSSVNDVYKVLSSSEKSQLKKYASELTATPATGLDPMRGRDPYRRSFNDFKEVKVDAI